LINPLQLQDPSHVDRLFNACAVLHNMLLDYDDIDDWKNHMKKARFNASDDTFDVTYVNIQHSQMMDDILFNEVGANSPYFDAAHNVRFLELHSSEQSDREMNFRLRSLIQHFFIAKEKKDIWKLKALRKTYITHHRFSNTVSLEEEEDGHLCDTLQLLYIDFKYST
jgi:hypothetical protein